MPLIADDLLSSEVRPVDTEAIERLLSFCARRTVRKKGVVFRAGDPADTLYYLVNGSVSVTALDDEGHEVVLAYLKSGDFIGEVGLFYKLPRRTAQVRARTQCELAIISYNRLRALFKGALKEYEAAIMYAVGMQLCERLLKTSRRVSQLTTMDVAGRIARTLLDMCHEPDAMSHPEGTQIHISRQEIARIVGCSRETVGRVLRQMAEDGMIEAHGMDIVVYHSR